MKTNSSLFITAILFGLLGFSCNTDISTFRLKGTIDNVDSGLVVLRYCPFEVDRYVVHIDTCKISNGDFLFTGKITEPISAIMMFCNKEIELYIEPSNMQIKLNCKSDELTLVGSKTYDDYLRMLEFSGDLRAEKQECNNKFEELRKRSNEETDPIKLSFINNDIDKIRLIIDSINTEISGRNISFVRSNLDSYISVEIFNNIITRKLLTVKESRLLFDSLSARIKNTSFAKLRIDKMICAAENTEIGAIAPDFSTKDIDGIPIRLSDFRGEYVFLDFWASWCGPCMESEPYIEKLYEKYKYQNLTFIAISYDWTENDWKKAAKRYGYKWHNVAFVNSYDNYDQGIYDESDINVLYISNLPNYILINPEGKIIGRWDGFNKTNMNQIAAMLEKEIGK